MNSKHEQFRAGLGVLLSMATWSGAVGGQTYQWSSVAGGSWFAPVNWSPTSVPATDSDTAVIAGNGAMLIDIAGANATAGLVKVTNPAAELRVRAGSQLTLGVGATIDGTLSIGESAPGLPAIVRFGSVFGTDVLGSGRVVLRAPPIDPTRAQFLVPLNQVASWSKSVLIEGTGALLGTHKIPGVVRANHAGGAALEFRAASIDGLGTGVYTADGAVLRLFQGVVSNARIETINGGRLELSAPTWDGTATKTLLRNSTVRGTMRSVVNTTIVENTDFDGRLEVLPATGVVFSGAARKINMTAIVRSDAGAGNATLSLGIGPFAGRGEILLNADTDPAQASLDGDSIRLGSVWIVTGHGSVSGKLFIDNTVAVEGPSLCPLLFRGDVDGTGTLEARNGVLEFAEASVRNIRINATGSGFARASKDGTWTSVRGDAPLEVVAGAELKVVSSVLTRPISVQGSKLRIGASTTTLNAEAVFGPGPLSVASYLRSDAGAILAGSGIVRLVSTSEIFPAAVDATQLTTGESISIRGTGMLWGTLKVLGTIVADDPAEYGLWIAGDISGSAASTIEIDTGEVVIGRRDTNNDLSTCSTFRVHGAPGSKPLRIGNGIFYTNRSPRVAINSLDVDASAIISQALIDLTGSVFRKPVVVTGPTSCRVFAGCRFESDLILTPGPTGGPELALRSTPPVINRLVFANKQSGANAAALNLQNMTGTFSSRIEGTGVIRSASSIGGVLAPSDESNASPAGIITFSSGALTFSPDVVYEADVLSIDSYDRLDITSGVTVNGTLRISAAPNFYPPPSYNFHLIRGTATGAFTTVIGPPGFITTMTYNKAGALARFEKTCGSDLNADGRVDDADFLLFCAGYDLMLCADPSMPEACPADLNRDREVDDTDFRTFVLAYAQMLCP